MKEVFVVYGWTKFSSIDWAMKPPVFEIFDNFDSAHAKFQECVKDVFESYKSNPPKTLNAECVKKSLEAELFADYNCGRGFDYPEGDVLWSYSIVDGESAEWAILPADGFCWGEEMDYPNIYIEKMKVNS